MPAPFLCGFMYTFNLPQDKQYDHYGTLDIETNGLDGTTNELAAIGVGVYRASKKPDIEVFTRGNRENEVDIIRSAFNWLNEQNIDAIVTYNGREFDFPFVDDRLDSLGVKNKPSISTANHIDLFPPRKQAAERDDEKWPSLEESLTAYGLDPLETVWNGQELTNTIFGERFAQEYFTALSQDSRQKIRDLEKILFEYTASDIEGNIALYEAEINRNYQPKYNF